MKDSKDEQLVRKYLKNKNLIIWVLTGSEESGEWFRNEIQNHPGHESAIREAGRILKSTRINSFRMPQAETGILKTKIEYSLKKKKKKKKRLRLIYTSVAAACILLGILFIPRIELITSDHVAGSRDSIPSGVSTEIELIVANREKILLDNNTHIKYGTEGTIEVIDKTDNSHIQTIASTDLIPEEMIEQLILRVPYGRNTSLELPDRSRVWVNSGSTLQFPSRFAADNRTITINGEIYLEVQPDKTCPFFVRTPDMCVQVLGTSFNVSAYEDDLFQSVVLVEGSVQVENVHGETRQMTPNQLYRQTGGQVTVSQVEVDKYISWKDGLFYFDRQSLEEVARRLSRYYSVNITCSNEVRQLKCSGKLVLFDDITSVLTTLKESIFITYEMDGENIKLSMNP